MPYRRYPFYQFKRDSRNRGGGGGGGCLPVIILFIISAYLFSVILMNMGVESGSAIISGFIFTFLIIKIIPINAAKPSKRQSCVFPSFGDGGFSREYFYTDQVKDQRGSSLTHKNYVATKIFPNEFNFVAAIRVNSENKEYLFTKSIISKMSVQFSDELPGSILLVLHPCFFELGSENRLIRQVEADSARRFVDFIKWCAR